MSKPCNPFSWAEARGELFFEFVRIYLGVGLFIKALFFIHHKGYVFDLLSHSRAGSWAMSAVIVHYVILAHLTGGLSVAFGVFTRVGALVQIPILFGAVFLIHLPRIHMEGARQEIEFSALVLFLLCLIFLRGGGSLSLDTRLAEQEAEPGTATAGDAVKQ